MNLHQLLCLFVLALFLNSCNNKPEETKQPNVVIIFLDDSGYSDFAPFGHPTFETPNVQKLAEEGIMFKNFYVPQAVCSASRSALISGCYPGRTKVFGAHGPNGRGLETTFPTIGEVFKKAGYKTAIFGKWHCGDQPETRPQSRGFEETCGLMYSNDMWRHHPESPDYWGQWPLQFWENGEVTIEDVDSTDQKMLTKWYTEHAVDFISRHKDEPFLLYVPHAMSHVPLFCSPEFEGKSGAGLYGDVITELDWSVGQINQALKDNGIDDNTIVIFSSDNGPWIAYGNHAGTTPFREAKGTTFDGGTRSATIIKYPAKLEGNQQSEKALMTIDLLPTLCEVANIPLPETEIDGKNVWDIISGKPNATNPHDYYAFTNDKDFQAVLSGDGKWKLHLPHNYRTMTDIKGKDGMPGKYDYSAKIELSLFDMENDPFETTNVIEDHPEIAEQLIAFAELHKKKFFSEN
ncbi:sulfatase [Draconibacterium sp. IB214405]|uniref:sulfatase family protein n=1 Tax=Draconibacterium sp. IB214405 TaxID=3097352 RepID=UPI002A0AB000|nr:sulfatase [Draconibacterium sp. IB214405]MDX8339533.1 sulfatase [Draconibacterium sp. IB214405]